MEYYTHSYHEYLVCDLLKYYFNFRLFLAKTNARRGIIRSKPGSDGNRRWKAGFVGGMFMRRKRNKTEGNETNLYSDMVNVNSRGIS